MNHQFEKSTTTAFCAKCNFDFLAHTKAAKCAFCGKIGEVNIQDEMLKCNSCIVEKTVADNEMLLDTDTFLRLVRSEEDASIRYSGDVFNAKTIANHEVKDKIFADESLTNEQKHQKYFQFLADRYTHFKQVIFEQSNIIHDSNVEVIVISNELREYGNQVREEIRTKIKQADEFYIPSIINKPQVKPKVAKKLSAIEKLIKTMMEMTGKSETECRLLIEQGNFKSKE